MGRKKRGATPFRVGVLDDCPFRRAAIREALQESQRYVVSICAPVQNVSSAECRGLDGLLVALERKETADDVAAPHNACSCTRLRGMVIGYALQTYPSVWNPGEPTAGFDRVFRLPPDPAHFVTHLDQIFVSGKTRDARDACIIPAEQLQLSKREEMVFGLFEAGREVKEVAAHLGLSPKTIYKFAERIRRKRGYATLHDLLFAAACSRRDAPNV